MTLTDLLPHRRERHAPAPVSVLPVVDVPGLVYTPMLHATQQTLHRPEPASVGRAACHLQTWPMWLVDTAKTTAMDPRWCPGCWPGRRCEVCGRPSGTETECPSCPRSQSPSTRP